MVVSLLTGVEVEQVHGPHPLLSRGHLVRSSGGLGSVSVPFSEEQEGLCRPRSGCSHLAERGKAADGWQVCGRAATHKAPAGCGSRAAGGLSCSRAAVLKVHVSGPQRALVMSVHFYHICT